MKPLRITPLLCGLVAVQIAAGSSLWAQETAPVTAAPVTAAPATGLAAPLVKLSPEAASFRDGLAAALTSFGDEERGAIDGFFSARGYTPFWTEPGTLRGQELVATLAAAGDQALPVSRYKIETLLPADPAAPVKVDPAREVALTHAYLVYAGDLAAGILTPLKIDENIALRPARPALSLRLAPLASEPLAAALVQFEPADPDYRRLMAEKARLQSSGHGASWGPVVSEGATLHPGDSGPRVAELRGRLARMGYLTASGDTLGTTFDPALEKAVASFQKGHGLVGDGVVGSRTLAAINGPLEAQLSAIAVNLERMRWGEVREGNHYLYVNIPDFTVRLYDGGKETWSSRVVVGKTHVTETAEFSGTISYMVVNPTWHIPDSIAIRDYLPKLQKDPMVLARQNIKLMTRSGTEINPNLVDFSVYTAENFPFRIKQQPQEANALGKVKFMFPNEFSIYLHDTPHKELFARDVRAFSNGCIRVQKPDELAALLLTGQVPDPATSFADWVKTGTEKTVTLKTRVPVHIVYRTVFSAEDGVLRFEPDVYGRDAKVFDALVAAGVALPDA